MAFSALLAFAEEDRKNILRIERRQLRDSSNPMELPEREFMANFRLSKAGFQQVFAELGAYLPQGRRKTAVPNELKVLAVLNFYANGSYQRNVGASYLCNMSQPTFSKCLHEVTNALNSDTILLKYIKFPSSRRERETIMQGFMDKFRFPGIIGCIDGTHVAIIRPVDHEETFFNRKNYHSLNVLLICDSHMNILHVDASFGGAAHDSYVWNQCIHKSTMEMLARNGECCWLLGDSGYAQRPWLMTPILGAAPGSPEDYYTRIHLSARNTIERCIGVLKARWRCLLTHRVLHYKPDTAGKIVNACVVLHNIANSHRVPLPEPEGEDSNNQQHQVSRTAPAVPDSTRNRLVERLFNARDF